MEENSGESKFLLHFPGTIVKHGAINEGNKSNSQGISGGRAFKQVDVIIPDW